MIYMFKLASWHNFQLTNVSSMHTNWKVALCTDNSSGQKPTEPGGAPTPCKVFLKTVLLGMLDSENSRQRCSRPVLFSCINYNRSNTDKIQSQTEYPRYNRNQLKFNRGSLLVIKK